MWFDQRILQNKLCIWGLLNVSNWISEVLPVNLATWIIACPRIASWNSWGSNDHGLSFIQFRRVNIDPHHQHLWSVWSAGSEHHACPWMAWHSGRWFSWKCAYWIHIYLDLNDIYICVYIYVHIYMWINIYICVYRHMNIYIYIVSIYLSIHLSIHPSICTHIMCL